MDHQSNPNQNQNGNGFRYTYSAREQAEIKKIREKYAPNQPAENKMERLRRLDAGATNKAQAWALVLGILGTLIMGFGMSMCMTDMGKILGSYRDMAMTVGILVGLLGGTLAGLAYPLYSLILRRERKRIAPEILRLTDELMK